MRLIDADAFRFIVADAQIQCDKHIMDAAAVLGVVKEVLDEQPTIDAVEVVHGWWIEKQEPITWCEDDVEVFWECSICECLSFGESPYCPNCGAKMDGERSN